MEYLTIGTIIDAFGLDGTAKIKSSTDRAEQRYKLGAKLFLCRNGERREITVASFRSSGAIDFVRFEEFKTPEEIKELKGSTIEVIKDRSDLEVGYYFYSDLQNCKVVDEDNNVLGIVSKVEEFPAQITLRVKREKGTDFFVPFIKQFILNVDIDQKIITIKVIGGML